MSGLILTGTQIGSQVGTGYARIRPVCSPGEGIAQGKRPKDRLHETVKCQYENKSRTVDAAAQLARIVADRTADRGHHGYGTSPVADQPAAQAETGWIQLAEPSVQPRIAQISVAC